MIVYCAKCEAANREDAELCGQCGRRLKAGPLQPTAPPKRHPVGESLAHAAGMAVASASANVAQVKKRARRTFTRKSRAIIAACNLAAVAIVAIVWMVSGGNRTATRPAKAPYVRPALTDVQLIVPTLVFELEAETERIYRAYAEDVATVKALGAAAFPAEYHRAIVALAMILPADHTNDDGSSITLEWAFAKLHGGSAFHRRAEPPYHDSWKLQGYKMIPSYFIVDDHTESCTENSFHHASGEWFSRAQHLEANGAEGIRMLGVVAIMHAQDRWRANRTAGESSKRFTDQFKVEESEGTYRVHVQVYDDFGYGDESLCSIQVGFSYGSP